MSGLEASPISQLLHTLGITREDLNKRSDQMRQFLTADTARPPRVSERDETHRQRSTSTLHSTTRSIGSTSSLGRSLSRASSTSIRDISPPATPVKHEPQDLEIPHRRMDSMEMVLERQRRHRKSRRERERESAKTVAHPPSPSPSNASQPSRGMDSVMNLRDDQSNTESKPAEHALTAAPEVIKPPPITPQKSKYYRDHTNLSGSSSARKDPTCKTETPTPTRPPPTQQPLPSQPLPAYYAYPSYLAYPHFVPVAYRPAPSQPIASSSSNPITPQPQRTQPSFRKKPASPIPPSSPPPPSSPMSSPTRRVNLVSSPGPMGPPPAETEYDDLPYTLPPGPYSPNKPDLSYAALVGRAILSSPEHRLTLQEIYDWITIVYPHYKRGETTWMNSIRHVLSTTVCFRKVPRDRSIGRTLWAIFDDDLECFSGGGFKKHLCKDYINASDSKDKVLAAPKGKSKGRKRADEDDGTDGRKTKKSKKDALAMANVILPESRSQSTFIASTPSLTSHPMFPPTRPTTHHQPYYQAQPPPPTFSAEILFPPLPPTAAFNRYMNNNQVTSATKEEESNDPSPPSSQSITPFSSVPPSISSSISSMSSSSVPELTPNRNSSSSPSSLPPTSDIDIDMTDSRSSSAKSSLPDISASISVVHNDSDVSSSLDDDDSIFNTSLLGPVRSWGQSPKDGGLQPGIELLKFGSDSEDEGPIMDRKGKKKQVRKNSFAPMPSSPTLNLRAHGGRSGDIGRPLTPISTFDMPSTPPRSTHRISSIRTPISHKGLHMSPSASLAHYKSNLDPPPIYTGGVAPLMLVPDATDDDHMRTPRKRLSHSSNANVFFGVPVTPRKLTFPSSSTDSPFRTPGGLTASPFRTPGMRGILDPHDPRTLLDEELNPTYDDSPGGLFGKGRGSLLYDSPGYDTHNKWW